MAEVDRRSGGRSGKAGKGGGMRWLLIVEFVNQKLEGGMALAEAVVEGAVSRFRPIVMTSLATSLGALPIALALGAGAESRISMGIAVIGGVMFSLVLTLYAIPAVCSYLSRPGRRAADGTGTAARGSNPDEARESALHEAN